MTLTEYQAALQWRYATKKFDVNKKLSAEQLQLVKDALRFSPSSSGVQPWVFLLVQDPAVRRRLREGPAPQDQVTDAPLLVVLCYRTTLDRSHVERYVDVIMRERNITQEQVAGFEQLMLRTIDQPPEALRTWAKCQVFIALGMLLSACAVNGIDACPMGGFNSIELDKVLQLEERGLASTVLCAVGFRSDEDKHAHEKKVRLPESDVFLEV
jgi:nitroreductase